MKLFHARRPDLNQTFISVSVLIRISFSYFLNLAICITLFAGKMSFQSRPFSFINHKIKFKTQWYVSMSRNFRCSSLMVFKSYGSSALTFITIRFICTRAFQRSFAVSLKPHFLHYFTRRFKLAEWRMKGFANADWYIITRDMRDLWVPTECFYSFLRHHPLIRYHSTGNF